MINSSANFFKPNTYAKPGNNGKANQAPQNAHQPKSAPNGGVIIQGQSVSPTTTSTSTSTTTALTPSALTNTQAQNILKKPPFTASDVSLFLPQVYSGAPKYLPAAAPTTPKTTTQWKSFVTDKMYQVYQKMSPNQSSSTNYSAAQSAASLLDDAKLKTVIPDVRLRTAAAMLKGTAADGAVNVLKSGTFSKVKFVNLDPGINAQSVKNSSGQNEIWVNSRYQNEDPRTLAALLAHEASHSDSTNSLAEEQINYAMDAMVYGQYVLADANLPLQKTEQVQRRNTELMGRMNDRDATTGNLRILTANGSNLYPNSNVSLPNFVSNIKPESSGSVATSSPGNAYLRNFVQKLTGKDLGSTIGYNSTTLKTIDASQTLFTLQQLIQIDKNLKLNVPSS
jgi:hypothetical protein